MVKDPETFIGKKIFISGGGDSALDWAIYFAEHNNSSVGLVHRSESFRAIKDSVDKVNKLQKEGKIDFYTNAEVINIDGEERIELIEIKQKDKPNVKIKVDTWLPLFGLSPKLGPIINWGLEIEKNSIKVDNTLDYQSNIRGFLL